MRSTVIFLLTLLFAGCGSCTDDAGDVSTETLEKTSLGGLKSGSPVNLEKALTLNTALGGHLVSGHVDGLGTLISERNDGRSIRYEFSVPQELAHYIAEKGSITIDGTSLTVNNVSGAEFALMIVPHTQERTVIQHYTKGTKVNVEVDLVARYLETLLMNMDDDAGGKVNMDMLTRAGFVK